MSQVETEGRLRGARVAHYCYQRPLMEKEILMHGFIISNLNGWSDGDTLCWLKVRVTNKAHVALMKLPNMTLRSFVTAQTALYNQFEPDSKRELYKAELENRKKLDNESWADYEDSESIGQ